MGASPTPSTATPSSRCGSAKRLAGRSRSSTTAPSARTPAPVTVPRPASTTASTARSRLADERGAHRPRAAGGRVRRAVRARPPGDGRRVLGPPARRVRRRRDRRPDDLLRHVPRHGPHAGRDRRSTARRADPRLKPRAGEAALAGAVGAGVRARHLGTDRRTLPASPVARQRRRGAGDRSGTAEPSCASASRTSVPATSPPLVVGTIVLSLLIGSLAGVLGAQRRGVGDAIFVVFADRRLPGRDRLTGLVGLGRLFATLFAAVAGIVSLRMLLKRAGPRPAADRRTPRPASRCRDRRSTEPAPVPRARRWSRRGRARLRQHRSPVARSRERRGGTRRGAAAAARVGRRRPIAAGSSLAVDGLTPLVTPNARLLPHRHRARSCPRSIPTTGG